MINACLLYRFSMSYEPRDFHGELDEMPETLKYGRAVDDRRRRYREWLWDAEFRDTIGAKVTRNGQTHDAYTVFRRNEGLRAVAFVNMNDTEPIVCEVALDQPKSTSMRWVSPEQTEAMPWLGKLELAPGSAAVVLEG
jgi:hypothetical protein